MLNIKPLLLQDDLIVIIQNESEKNIILKRFLKNTNVFSIILYHLPLKQGITLHFNKRESPSPNNA